MIIILKDLRNKSVTYKFCAHSSITSISCDRGLNKL